MEKRFQVFVSSTYLDLQEERRDVIEALLGIDCIPAGMELFPAGDDDQWTLIKRIIDQCDYYILISAGKYGSLHPDGKSYTQMEYEYAVTQGKPVIAFLHRNIDQLPAEKTELDPGRRQKLLEFRELAKQKLVKFWDSRDSLAKAVYQGIINVIRDKPAAGWVRADVIHDEKEVLQLQNRILLLEKELEPLRRAGILGGVLSSYTEIDWGHLFSETKSLDVVFAYAQTWRRSRTVELTRLACSEKGRIRVVLPDPDFTPVVAELCRRFACNESELKSRIYNAAGHFLSLRNLSDCKADIKVWFYPFAPLYTMYRFDTASVLSLYSHHGTLNGIITLLLKDGIFRNYMSDEFERFIRPNGKAKVVEDAPLYLDSYSTE